MAYKILKPDGTTLLTLADNTVDQSSTSLALVGKNYSGYGEFWNTNLVRLLSNSASVTSRPPRSPLTGQIWYDTSVKRLKVYDGGFRTVNGVPFSTLVPSTILTGDFWYDTINNQLKLYNGLDSVVIGPAFPDSAGESGWVLPGDSSTVNDADTDSAQPVLILKSYNTSLAIANSGDAFEASSTTADAYLPDTYGVDPEVVKGITVSGDLRVYGQISNYGLAVSFKIDNIAPVGNQSLNTLDPTFIDQATNQNNIISNLLDKLYPSNAQTTGSYQYPGFPIGTLARVVVYNNNGDTQVRLFRTVGTIGTSYWNPYNGIFAILNIID